LSAVIDWGDLARGDRATDLAAIWMLLGDVHERETAMRLYDASEHTWRRARGWAFLFGITLLDTGLIDHPRHARMGERTLRRLSAGPERTRFAPT
jgi:aminoglycoside phosphotransferase (APT) family kinase protein